MIWLSKIEVSGGTAPLEIAYKEIALPIMSANIPDAILLGGGVAAPKRPPETI
jgi:hypothetical protein